MNASAHVVPQLSPHQQSEQALNAILTAQWQGIPAQLVQSPPGAGKTGIVERVAMQEYALLAGRVLLATLTNEQAYDLARRLAMRLTGSPYHLLVRTLQIVPKDVQVQKRLVIITSSGQIPPGPCIVIANAMKWIWSDATRFAPFSCLIVDEAYQLPHALFQSLASLAARIFLVGDPGQIAPVVSTATERWRDNLAGPHQPCPTALLSQYPTLPTIQIPISRRLVADTIQVLQPVLYPSLPFVALSPPGARRVRTHIRGTSPIDAALDFAEQGASLVQIELPMQAGGMEQQFAEAVLLLIRTIISRQVDIRDDDGLWRPLQPSMLGVVCPHILQVSAVAARLPPTTNILVETAERFQGLERSVIIAIHPLAGRREEGDPFHLSPGRLSVSLSRHRLVCFLLTHQGIEQQLLHQVPTSDRLLDAPDEIYHGWRAHVQLQRALRGRTVSLV